MRHWPTKMSGTKVVVRIPSSHPALTCRTTGTHPGSSATAPPWPPSWGSPRVEPQAAPAVPPLGGGRRGLKLSASKPADAEKVSVAPRAKSGACLADSRQPSWPASRSASPSSVRVFSTVRPARREVTSPLCRSTARCWQTAGRLISVCSPNWVVLRGRSSRARIATRLCPMEGGRPVVPWSVGGSAKRPRLPGEHTRG